MIISFTRKLLLKEFVEIVSETNGISLIDTLDLMLSSSLKTKNAEAYSWISEFRALLNQFITNEIPLQTVTSHPFAQVLEDFFKNFPIKYKEEHIHLTGSLTAEFIWGQLQPLLEGTNSSIYEKKIKEVYGAAAWPIKSVEDVDRLIRLKDHEGFSAYLKILYLTKLIFISKQAHADAAYHLAHELYYKYNVGLIRLKFSLSRSTSQVDEQIPHIDTVTSEDVVMGLYDGFKKFQNEHPEFQFILSPSFRKEASFFDSSKYTNRKEHFSELASGFRKLQYRGFKIRSHHGETWHTLKKGIQAVDNAMNIWH